MIKREWKIGWLILSCLMLCLVPSGCCECDDRGTIHTLTLDSQGPGTVAMDPAGGTYVSGTKVQLMASPAS